MASCTRPSVMLDAYLDKSGALIVDTLPTGIIFRTRQRPCVQSLGFYDGNGTIWRIDSADPKSCLTFPVVYGASPRNSVTVVKSESLVVSGRYGIHVSSIEGDGLAEFSLDRQGVPHFPEFRQTSTIHEPLGVRFVGASKRTCEQQEKRPCHCGRYGCAGWEPLP